MSDSTEAVDIPDHDSFDVSEVRSLADDTEAAAELMGVFRSYSAGGKPIGKRTAWRAWLSPSPWGRSSVQLFWLLLLQKKGFFLC